MPVFVARVATTGNIGRIGLDPVDGVTLGERNIVLVKAQNDTTQNGLFYADDSDWQPVVRNLDAYAVFVDEGGAHATTLWVTYDGGQTFAQPRPGNSSITDLAIGSRTINPSLPADGNTEKLTVWLSWLANAIWRIIGLSLPNWFSPVPITLLGAKNHVDAEAPHSGHALTEHDHAIADVTGLQEALNGKLAGAAAINTSAPLTGGAALSTNPTLGLAIDSSMRVAGDRLGTTPEATVQRIWFHANGDARISAPGLNVVAGSNTTVTKSFNAALQTIDITITAAGGGAPSGPAGGGLTGTYPNPTLRTNAVGTGNIQDYAVDVTKIAPGANGQALITTGGFATWALPGGDLTGSWPNPTIAFPLTKTVSSSNPALSITQTGSGTAGQYIKRTTLGSGIQDVMTIGATTTTTAAAGLGTQVLFTLQNSSGGTSTAAMIRCVSVNPGSTTFQSRFSIVMQYGTAQQHEAFRAESDGAQALIGLYGAPAVPQAATIAAVSTAPATYSQAHINSLVNAVNAIIAAMKAIGIVKV